MLRAVRLTLVFVLLPSFISCTANYTKNVSVDVMQTAHLLNSHQLKRTQNFTLHRGSKIYLKPLSYSEQSIESSTAAPPSPKKQYMLETELLKTLLTTFPHTVKGEHGTNLQDAFLEAAAMQAEILFYPYFDQLNTLRETSEDRGTHEDSSSSLDDSSFTVVIFDVYSQHMLDTIHVHSTTHLLATESGLRARLQAATKVAVQNISSM